MDAWCPHCDPTAAEGLDPAGKVPQGQGGLCCRSISKISSHEFTFIELVGFSLEGFPFTLFVRLGGFEGRFLLLASPTFGFEEGFLMLFVRLGGFEGLGDFVWVLFGRVGILDMFFDQGI